MRLIAMTRLLLIIVAVMYLGGCATATTSGTRETPSEIPAHAYNKDFDTVFNKAIDAAGAMGWQVIFTDKSTGIITAKTPTNIWTWGDNVSIRVYQIENNAAKVDVSSGTPGQLLDWGRNRRNISGYYDKLDNLLHSGQ